MIYVCHAPLRLQRKLNLELHKVFSLLDDDQFGSFDLSDYPTTSDECPTAMAKCESADYQHDEAEVDLGCQGNMCNDSPSISYKDDMRTSLPGGFSYCALLII